jgi:hypothetical protein
MLVCSKIGRTNLSMLLLEEDSEVEEACEVRAQEDEVPLLDATEEVKGVVALTSATT